MFLFFPIGVDVEFARTPWMNWLIIAFTVIIYPFAFAALHADEFADALWMTAGGGHAIGYVAHIFVHDGLLHLLGNMLFLWVFGNAVCAKIGNFTYLAIYLALGVGAGLVSELIDPGPAVGASGAINGVVGAYLFWYALNDVRMFYCYWFFSAADAGDTDVSGYWVILLWLGWDIWGALMDHTGKVRYMAHIGGLGIGLLIAFTATATGWIQSDDDEASLLDLVRPKKQTTARSSAHNAPAWARPAAAPADSANSLPRAGSATSASPARRRAVHDDAPIPLDDESAAGRTPQSIDSTSDGRPSHSGRGDAQRREPRPAFTDDDPIPLDDPPSKS